LLNGRCFNFDPVNQSAYKSDSYRLLNDVHIERPGAVGRLLGISAGSFPDDPFAKDQWYIKGPRTALAGTWGHFLTSDNPDEHTMPYGLQRLLGIDPETGVADPRNQEKLFQEMMRNPALNGWIQTVACSLYQLGEKNFGILNSELQNNAGWMLDPTMFDVLTKPSHFSLDDVGLEGWPVTAFFTPPRAEKAANAWLRSLFELMQLVFQQRELIPLHPLAIICDELKFWGKDCQSAKDSLNVMRDKNIALHLYLQSYAQLVEMYGEAGAAEVLSACCLQIFGCNDLSTRKMIREKLGQTKYQKGGLSSDYASLVDLLSDDAIDRYLSRSSPLQLVLPPDTPPMMLGRLAYKTMRTKEGTYYEGLPLKGYYDDHLGR
jgi:hypothetical protein